jgi:hypothetical protein
MTRTTALRREDFATRTEPPARYIKSKSRDRIGALAGRVDLSALGVDHRTVGLASGAYDAREPQRTGA